MKTKLSNKEIMRKRKNLRRKAQIRKTVSVLIVTLISIVGLFTYLASAESSNNYVPQEERNTNATYKTLDDYTPKTNRNHEIRKASVRATSSYIVTYADTFFYGKVLEIGNNGDNTIVSFQCLDDKKSNPIIVSFSGTVDLIVGDEVKVYGSYLNSVGDKAESFEGITTVKNPEDTIYMSGNALVKL